MATVKINGKEITVDDGTLILDAARQAGFEVPTFCYQARLSRLGSCRMCLVEIAGQKKLQPSCVTPVMHGMEVFTENETVKSARSSVLEFLLANHPLDCPTCDKGGECELQDFTFKFGPRKSAFGEWKRRFHEKDEILSPVIVKNHNRCIHCERCVRICDEVVGASALGGIGRGSKLQETSFWNTTLDCDHCGNCIEVCPVGSFMSLPYRYKSRPWDLKETDSVCPFCATGCQFTIGERGGEVVRVRSRVETGINKETLCARGRFGWHFIQSEQRIKSPMVKRNGNLIPVTWEEALAEIKEKTGGIAHGVPMRVAGIASGRLTNEEAYLFQDLMRNVFKTNNLDSSSRWAGKGAVPAMADLCGLAGGGAAISDALKSGVIFVIGASISDENPITDYLIRTAAADKRKTLILAYPRRIKLDKSAAISLKYFPGREGALISALTSAVRNGSAAAGAAGVNEADIAVAAKRMSEASSVSVFVGTDFLRLTNGQSALKEMADLSDALRQSGKNIIVMPLLDRSNQRGAWDMGVHPSFMPGYAKLEGGKEGMSCAEIIEASAKGEIDALYIAGEDVVSMYPDYELAREAVGAAGFVVVQDIFMTETARMADVVLPGVSFAEKDGTFTNQEGRVQRLKRAVPPVGKAREDWRILRDVGRLIDDSFGFDCVEDIFNEITKKNALYDGMAYHEISNTGILTRGKQAVAGDRIQEGIAEKPEPAEDKEFPLLLITGNHLFHSGRMSQKADILRKLLPEPFVEISGSDAAALGINEGDLVSIKGRSNEVSLKARVCRGSMSGVVFIAENFEDAPVNRFFKKGAGIPRVKITKAG